MSLRVLVVHNAYRQRGGEDTVVEAEVELLRTHGHEVSTLWRHNDELQSLPRAAALGQLFWSTRTWNDVAAQVSGFRPDVIHVHNSFPLVSPSVYWAADRAGVPVVQTLHNFRLHCPQAMYLREGLVCEDCLGRVPWRGAVRGCYRGSVPQSAALAGMLTLHRALGTWRHKISRYIALNDFCRRKFIEGGLPADRVVVKPNFVDLAPPEEGPRGGLLFVGRLSEEKGIRTLAGVCRQGGFDLRVAGSGPEREQLCGLPGVELLGTLMPEQVRAEMGRALALVMPSIWFETFGMVIIEAFASGLPVIASRLGSMEALVEPGVTGLLFEPGDPRGLRDAMVWALANPDRMREMGRNARRCYELHYTADQNYARLLDIYRSALAELPPSRPFA